MLVFVGLEADKEKGNIMKLFCTVITMTFLCTGCGTVLNVAFGLTKDRKIAFMTSGKTYPYGGIILDASMIYDSSPLSPLTKPFFIIDMPLSLVGDTITLPYTIFAVMEEPPDKSGILFASDQCPDKFFKNLIYSGK